MADSLYWMSRYLERAENIARIVDVNLQLLLDFQGMDDKKLEEHWEPLVKSLGDEKLFQKLYKKSDSRTVTDFLTFNKKNPNSILSCLILARENARSVRDQISLEMWEEINRLYLFIRSTNAKEVWSRGPYDFYREIKQSSYLFQGLTSATVTHDEGREFSQVGRFLERADMTSRILDVKYHILLPSALDVGGEIDTVQWAAVLRSCSAYEAYQQMYASDLVPWKVAQFLIFGDLFPRSIRFCVRTLDYSLHRVSGSAVGFFSNSAEKLSGRLVSDLTYAGIEDVLKTGLHEYLDQIQLKLTEIGSAVFENYIFFGQTNIEEEIQIQQQQQ
ncbi:MAG: alpha-E domain-containing protein [Methylacidiphilales bacterium]|nr:alpha-E domain-containing protein [Candidatus Methylacidiphilales bacterium]